MKKIFVDTKYAIGTAVSGIVIVAAVLSLFLLVKTFSALGWTSSEPYSNYISINGYAEITAVPDIATFTFTIEETSESSESAQMLASQKIDSAIKIIKEKGIEERDIKTLNYNIYPKYEWMGGVCNGFRCDSGQNVLIGYTASQTTEVKVRKTDQSGEIFSSLTNVNITNISGLSFKVDDEENLKNKAREKAIQNAKENAIKLSKDLGVRLVKITGFSEDDYSYRPDPYMYGAGSDMMTKEMSAIAPEINPGENIVNSRVYITYKIR
jgi:uncharacterized protein